MTVAYMIIFAFMTYLAFEYFCDRGPLFDPGALMGFGVAGLVGLLGFVWRHWDAAAALAVCLLGGCFGSGMHRINGGERGERLAIGYR